MEDDMPLAKIAKSSRDSDKEDESDMSQEDDVPLAKIATNPLMSPVKDKCALNGSKPTPGVANTVPNSKPSAKPDKNPPIDTLSKDSVDRPPLNSIDASTNSLNNSITGQPRATVAINERDNADSPKPVKVEVPLPPGVNEDILKDINELKLAAQNHVKGKFFTPQHNQILLQFARKCRAQPPRMKTVSVLFP